MSIVLSLFHPGAMVNILTFEYEMDGLGKSALLSGAKQSTVIYDENYACIQCQLICLSICLLLHFFGLFYFTKLSIFIVPCVSLLTSSVN